MNAVAEPIRAVTHIQNTAPAPPADTAATTPTRFPIPTRVAVDTTSACSADMPFPNVLRLYSGDYEVKHTTQYYIMETNIDDMNSQIFGYLYERLFAIGALDAWTTPIFMKKNRKL